MTEREVIATVERIVSATLEAHDASLAAAERRFRQVTGLAEDDATDQALGYLAGAIGEAYTQAVTAAFWAGHNRG